MRTYLAAGLLALGAAPAFAGGIERSNQSMAILFERGNYLEFGASYTMPNVSGVLTAVPAISSGNMSKSFAGLDLRFKGQINEQLSYAVILDQPVGASVAYPAGLYPFAESTGTINSTALTGVLRYAFDGGFSAYGGLRAVRTSGSVFLSPLAYTMSISPNTAYGYLVGIAYERPEIAARVSLTYNSRVKHNFDAIENGAPSNFSTTIPESLHLEFQTGIMEDTLLFGGIRWVNWKQFDITPPLLGSALVDLDKSTTTYTIGVGRRFNENWSGSVSLSHEGKGGGVLGNLGPTDGFTALGIGASYTVDNVRISGGVQYRKVGGGATNVGTFSGNSAWSAGMRIGFSF